MTDRNAAHTDLIAHLYASLAARDGVAMGACYADDARFSNPAFGSLDASGPLTASSIAALAACRASESNRSGSGN